MAPGGGSVSALAAALSAGLASMVANLTHGKREFKRVEGMMADLSIEAQGLKVKALELVDADTAAFNRYIAAMRLPKKSDEEKIRRAEAMEEAAKEMTRVPLATLKLAVRTAELAETALRRGNPTTASDAGTALAQAEAAATGAYLNVMINLPSVADREFTNRTAGEAEELFHNARTTARRGVKLAIKKTAYEG